MRRPAPASRRGNYTLFMGFAVLVVVGFAAIAVDISLISMGSMQSQAAADAASHAALVAHRNDPSTDMDARKVTATAAANFFLVRNEVGMGTADLDDIRFGVYDASTRKFEQDAGLNGTVNSVEVDISRRGGNAMGLLLAPIIGVNTHELASSATVAQQQRAVMLVQDFSCSMNSGPDAGRAIDISRNASTLFLDYMTDYNQAGDMLGLAGYAEHGVLGPPREEEDIGASIGGASAFPTLATLIDKLFDRATTSVDRPFVELSYVAEEQAYLRSMFKSICSTEHGCPDDPLTGSTVDTPYPTAAKVGTCTNPAIAMRQALEELTSDADPSYFRAMVVMSDGLFNCAGGINAARAVADEAYNLHGIHIWTVLLTTGSGSADQMREITRGYGTLSETPEVSELPKIYADIAASLPTAIVD